LTEPVIAALGPTVAAYHKLTSGKRESIRVNGSPVSAIAVREVKEDKK
jgi:hypothetical protein